MFSLFKTYLAIILILLALQRRSFAFFGRARGIKLPSPVASRRPLGVASFDNYVRKVKEIIANNTNVSERNVYDLAAALMAADAEKEKELAVKDMEKVTEKEMAAYNATMVGKINGLTALRRRDLASITQRFVLESIFRLVLEKLDSDASLAKILESSSGIRKEAKNDIRTNKFRAKMSSVNEALLDENFRKAAWTAIGLDPSLEMPILDGQLLYGLVSSILHSPNIIEVYLSDESSLQASQFYLNAGALISKKLVLYSDADAAGASLWC